MLRYFVNDGSPLGNVFGRTPLGHDDCIGTTSGGGKFAKLLGWGAVLNGVGVQVLLAGFRLNEDESVVA